MNILLCRLVLGGLLLESQELEEKRMVVARLDFLEGGVLRQRCKVSMSWFFGGAEEAETLHRLSQCDLSR